MKQRSISRAMSIEFRDKLESGKLPARRVPSHSRQDRLDSLLQHLP